MWEMIYTFISTNIQYCISALISAVVSFCIWIFNILHQKKDKQKLMEKYALLLASEIQTHLTITEFLKSSSKIPSSAAFIMLHTDLWIESRKYLTGLSFAELKRLAMYYQTVSSFNFILLQNSGKPIKGIMNLHIQQLELNAKAMAELLAREHESNNKRLHQTNYEKLIKASDTFEAEHF